MAKIIYITTTRLPTEKAHGLATMKIAEAFTKIGFELEMIAPRRWFSKIKNDPFAYYNTSRTFKIIKMPAPDFLFLPLLQSLVFYFHVLVFSLAAIVYVLFKGGLRSAIFFSHDHLPLYFLSFLGAKIFYDIHDFPTNNIFYRRVLRRSIGLAVQTKWKIDALKKDFDVSPSKIIYWPNGTDVKLFKKDISQERARQELNLPRDKKIILYTGHLFGWKGVDNLALAARNIYPVAEIFIVGGTDEDRKRFTDFITREKLPGINLIPFQDWRLIPLWLKAADVLVLPNTAKEAVSKFYTSPMKLFEYMASGRPIVASDIPSLTEILNKRNGFLFEPDNPAALAEQVKYVLNNPTEVDQRTRQAQQDVDQYTWENRAIKIKTLMGSDQRRILITAGIYPPAVGGPAQYAKNLKDSLERLGHRVTVKTFGGEKYLPTGIRHLYFFLKVLPALIGADFGITLDTFSVGLPTVAAGSVLRKKIIIRTGGDFLWEQYVERTSKKVLLREFYKTEPIHFSFKERWIFKLTRWTLKNAATVVFSTQWQNNIWQKPYNLDSVKIAIIENYYGPKEASDEAKEKIFIAGTRQLRWKNLDILTRAFQLAHKQKSDLILDTEMTNYGRFLEKIKKSYAVILTSLGDISPNMILDAVRLNKPFILTRENGLHERLKDVGVFVNPLDEKEIADKILWLADDKNYAAAKKKIESFNLTHSWSEIAGEFLKIHKS